MTSPHVALQATAKERQRLLVELYGASAASMLADLRQAAQTGLEKALAVDLRAPNSAQALERLAEHLDGCRRLALKLSQQAKS